MKKALILFLICLCGATLWAVPRQNAKAISTLKGKSFQIQLAGLDQDLHRRVQRIQKTDISGNDGILLVFGFQSEINGRYQKHRSERAVAHNYRVVADFGDLQILLRSGR